MPTLTKEIAEAAIVGFEVQKQRLDFQIAELRAMLNGGPVPVVEPKVANTRRKISPAALKRMKEGQQRRWAKARSESAASAKVAPKASKPKRKLSAAGKANIIAALKKRWAAKRAAAAAIRVLATAKQAARKKAA